MHYLLFYEVADDYLSRRAQFRDEHLAKAWKASARGELVLGGALADPVDGAVLLFQGESPEVAERFARTDPYVTSGIVKRWYVRHWTTVAGENASAPVGHPAGMGSFREKGAVLRMWKARATPGGASAYVEHATAKVFPALRAIQGHRGACLLRRVLDGTIELVVLTLWESMAAVRRFAGAEPEKAVIEPAARAVLTECDQTVAHFEVVHADLRLP